MIHLVCRLKLFIVQQAQLIIPVVNFLTRAVLFIFAEKGRRVGRVWRWTQQTHYETLCRYALASFVPGFNQLSLPFLFFDLRCWLLPLVLWCGKLSILHLTETSSFLHRNRADAAAQWDQPAGLQCPGQNGRSCWTRKGKHISARELVFSALISAAMVQCMFVCVVLWMTDWSTALLCDEIHFAVFSAVTSPTPSNFANYT